MYTSKYSELGLNQLWTARDTVLAHFDPTVSRFKMIEGSIYTAPNRFSPVARNMVHFGLIDLFLEMVQCVTKLPKIDLIVYLRTSPEIAYERVVTEHMLDLMCPSFEYILSRHVFYETVLESITTIPVLVLDGNDIENIETECNELLDLLFKRHPNYYICFQCGAFYTKVD